MGQTISLAHLAPFVDISRQKIRKEIENEFEAGEINATSEQIDSFVEARLHREIEAAMQTIEYQLITLQTTNGQAPFVTVFMYLEEVAEGQTRDDLAHLIEVMLRQRIKGVKNKTGKYVNPSFPKLVFTLSEACMAKDSKYYYLRRLAAECSAYRMVPDYISEKKMKELKGGNVYGPMGLVIT